MTYEVKTLFLVLSKAQIESEVQQTWDLLIMMNNYTIGLENLR